MPQLPKKLKRLRINSANNHRSVSLVSQASFTPPPDLNLPMLILSLSQIIFGSALGKKSPESKIVLCRAVPRTGERGW